MPLASGNVFPALPGLAWELVKDQEWATRKQRSVSGRTLTTGDYLAPVWVFTWSWNYLRDSHDVRQGVADGGAFDELRTIAGFFAQQNGGDIPFLIDDPSDDTSPTNQLIGTGDGTTTQFQLARPLGVNLPTGGFLEPITAINVLSNVMVNGITVGSYTVNGDTGVVTFSSAPGVGQPVNATFTYYFRVRFQEDTLSATNFLYQLWRVRQLKFESVLL